VGLGGEEFCGWRLAGAGAPECAEDGVDDSGKDFQGGAVAAESVDDSVAHGSYVFEDAAGEGEVGEPVGAGVGSGEALDDKQRRTNNSRNLVRSFFDRASESCYSRLGAGRFFASIFFLSIV
jgi:hypothetical protein